MAQDLLVSSFILLSWELRWEGSDFGDVTLVKILTMRRLSAKTVFS